MPLGRNSKIGLIDIETLLLAKRFKTAGAINLNNFNDRNFASQVKRQHYIPTTQVYTTYLNLVRAATEQLGLNPGQFHMVEMILFALADQKLFVDLIDKLQVQTNRI